MNFINEVPLHSPILKNQNSKSEDSTRKNFE